jgi:hypothetical protein
MVVNFVVVVSVDEGEEVAVSAVLSFPALSPAKKKADKLAADQPEPYDVVVWDVNTNEAVYSPFNKQEDAQPQG